MRPLADNPWEAFHRERKAIAIAKYLHDLGVPAGVASVANAEARHIAARDAGQHDPSPAAWERVCDLLEAFDAFDRRAAADGDPFEVA
jgi:hypothetical protein